MKNCVDEGILQTWFDGELRTDEAAAVAAHVKTCADCAAMARVVEAENLLLSEGLAGEFAAPVPSERMRQRLDLAVAEIERPRVTPVGEPFWRPLAEFFGSFRPMAYASVAAMILLVAIVGFVYLKGSRNQTQPSIAQQGSPAPVNPAPKQSPEQVVKQPEEIATPNGPGSSKLAVANPKSIRRPKAAEPNPTTIAERQYEDAIAKLDDALKSQPPMRPALQVEYEYNLAVIDNAIKSTRDAAKKSPKDPLANQFMLAAYQSKVDFMNQIADARSLER